MSRTEIHFPLPQVYNFFSVLKDVFPKLGSSYTFSSLPGKNKQTPLHRRFTEKRPEDTEKNNKVIVTERAVPKPTEPTELEIADLGHSEQVLLKMLIDLLETRAAILSFYN